MSTSLKISANTSEVKKSLLDLSRDVKNLGKSKVSIFSEADRKFVKSELNKEIGLMKDKLVANRTEISKLVKEQTKLEKNSRAELDARKKILSAYQQQTKLAQQMDRLNKQSKDMGRFGGMGGSGGGSTGITGMLGKLGGFLGGAALGVGAAGIARGYQANNQYVAGVGNRVRLRGLGGSYGGSPEQLAEAGMTEQDFIKRQIQGVSRLGRSGGSSQSILQQAKFERSYGLEEGSMMNTSTALRSSFGGRGADQAQFKLQASIMAAGIEDALAPYLESATELLSEINKNGVTNTDEMINMFAQLVKDGQRTPEQIAESFKTLDAAVKSSSGEANAFLQTAFARGGIGGGTVGATRLAMSSGGIFGLSEEDLKARGYNEGLIKNMKGSGFTQGLGSRNSAILNQFKQSGGVGGKNINDITDINQMVGLSNMSNSVFGTQGTDGFDTLKMMEQVQNKQMSQKQFESKVQEMKDKKDPQIDRLNKINQSLEGQTEILRNINTNLMEVLGKSAVKVGNIGVESDNMLVQGTGNVAGAVDRSGVLDSGLAAAKSSRSNLVGGGFGEKLYDFFHGSTEEQNAKYFKDAEAKFSNRGTTSSAASSDTDAMSKAVETGMTKAMSNQKTPVIQNNNNVKVRVQNSDGRVTEKTHK